MNKKINQEKYIRRKARLKLVFKIFPEINEVYKNILKVVEEAKELERENALIQTHEHLSQTFQALMDFEYLDNQGKNIDLDKYDTENIKNLLYKAGCSANSVIILHYYNKKTEVLDKYFVQNIEQTISDYYDLYESPKKNQPCYNLADFNEKKQECIKAKEAYEEILKREESFKKASKSTRKKNIRNITIFICVIIGVIISTLAYLFPIPSYAKMQDSNNTNNTEKKLPILTFSSISEIFNTNIVVHDLKSKQCVLDKTLKKLSDKKNISNNNISIKLKSSYLICLGNNYSSIKLNQKNIDINTAEIDTSKGIYFIYENKILKQVSYDKYLKTYK